MFIYIYVYIYIYLRMCVRFFYILFFFCVFPSANTRVWSWDPNAPKAFLFLLSGPMATGHIF